MTDESLFAQALALAPTERAAFLDNACSTPEQRREIEELLAAHATAAGFMAPPLAATADFADAGETRTAVHDPDRTSLLPAGESTGLAGGSLVAGRYRLGRLLGEGGMGSVYLAEQTEPIRRQVAVKLIKAGTDTARVIARFEAERQALALMDHPNIARVFDAGTHDHGRPFFVMELVDGVPLTAYCDEKRLTIATRLALFVQVCQAVQHAHQKGIIHRDLKPSNILVTEIDGRPVPKVIDFGLAKALAAGAIPDATLDATAFGSVLGTPLYMSPEQADGTVADIDTRADVYALGAILYELLTGCTPIDRATLRGAAMNEIIRVIREVEPVTPVRRLAADAARANVALARQLEPRKLSKIVGGDLEWIAMKCLEKDRTRRYDTANALADDVRHFLADEPVVAGPPSRWYRTRKFVKRNRGPVIAAAVVFLALLAGIAGTTAGMLRAVDAEWRAGQDRDDAIDAKNAETLALTRAIDARHEEGKAKDAALKAAKAAREETDIAKSANNFVRRTFFTMSRQESTGVRAMNLGGLLDRAAREVDRGNYVSRPLVEAHIRWMLGDGFRYVGFGKAWRYYERAHELFVRERGEDHDDTQGVLLAMARYTLQGGSAMPGGAQSKGAQLDTARAELLYRKWLATHRRVHGGDDADSAGVMHDLAALCLRQKKFDEAEVFWTDSLAIWLRSADHEYMAVFTMNALATLYQSQNKHAQVEPLFAQVMSIQRRAGPDQLLGLTHVALVNLCDVYSKQGKYEEMEALVRGQLLALEKAGYESQWQYSHARGLLGESLTGRKKYAEAEPLLLASYKELEAAERLRPREMVRAPKTADEEEALRQRNLHDPQVRPEHVIESVERLAKLYDTWAKPEKAVQLGGLCVTAGNLERSRERRVEAVRWYDKAIERLDAVPKADPRAAEARFLLRDASASTAGALDDLARFVDAIPHWGRAAELSAPADRPQYLLALARDRVRAGQLGEGVAGLDALLKRDHLPPWILIGASAALTAVAAAEKDVGRREEYAAQAVSLLWGAKRVGFFADPAGVWRIKESAEFSPLRTRDDFRRLLAAIEGTGPRLAPAPLPREGQP